MKKLNEQQMSQVQGGACFAQLLAAGTATAKYCKLANDPNADPAKVAAAADVMTQADILYFACVFQV